MFRRRTLILVMSLIAIGGLVWWFAPFRVVKWIGGYELTVHIQGAEHVRSVRLVPINDCRAGESVLAMAKIDPATLSEWKSTTIDPYDGRPITLFITMSGSDSQSGRELSRFQFSALILIGELANGRRFAKLVDIPDSRVSREVHVQLP